VLSQVQRGLQSGERWLWLLLQLPAPCSVQFHSGTYSCGQFMAAPELAAGVFSMDCFRIADRGQ